MLPDGQKDHSFIFTSSWQVLWGSVSCLGLCVSAQTAPDAQLLAGL